MSLKSNHLNHQGNKNTKNSINCNEFFRFSSDNSRDYLFNLQNTTCLHSHFTAFVHDMYRNFPDSLKVENGADLCLYWHPFFLLILQKNCMDYQLLCEQTADLARAAGKFILEQKKSGFEKDIQTKGLHDFVTKVDKASESMIIQKLQKLLPSSSFLAEESSGDAGIKELTWIIDPLDGTTNFIHHLPLFTVSIALMHRDELVVGVIYEPNLDECFYAWKDGGAWLNGAQIKVSDTEALHNSLLATGFPYYDYQHLDAYMEFLKYTIKETRGLRRLGSAALDMAWVACGRFEAFYEYGLRPWDVAAGACIVSEAGGKVTDFSNQPDFLQSKEIVASNGLVHDEIVNEIREFFFNGKKS
jgi:myo-inositol-1(or 4)-monophosphatase